MEKKNIESPNFFPEKKSSKSIPKLLDLILKLRDIDFDIGQIKTKSSKNDYHINLILSYSEFQIKQLEKQALTLITEFFVNAYKFTKEERENDKNLKEIEEFAKFLDIDPESGYSSESLHKIIS